MLYNNIIKGSQVKKGLSSMKTQERNHLIEWIMLIENLHPGSLDKLHDYEIIEKYHLALKKLEDESINA